MYAFIYPFFFHYFFMTALFELCPRFVFCFSALGFWFLVLSKTTDTTAAATFINLSNSSQDNTR